MHLPLCTWSRHAPRLPVLIPALLLTAFATTFAAPAQGIEMFTYFGDGSRIGLPSLEVPVEAYPGIPLRSDRLRARRRALQGGPGAAVRMGPQGLPTRPGGIIIRTMPRQPTAAPVPVPVPIGEP